MGFFTHFDISTITSEAQLGTMEKERSGTLATQATTRDVAAWAQGKHS